MLTLNWEKIDKFYIILTVVLIFMAVMVIFTFRGIFSAFLTAYEVDQNAVGEEVRLDKEKLDEAYDFVYNKNSASLEVRE